MWFKNLRLLCFDKAFRYDPEKLAQQLETLRFKPCPKSLPLSYGFVPPLGEDTGALVFAQNPFQLIRLRIEEKVLPPAVVRDKLQQEIKSIEQKTGRRVYKDEKERIKDEIYQSLLVQAFTKSSYINAYIDSAQNWLVVECASSKKLANFISLLNKCLGTTIHSIDHQPATKIMTRWLLHKEYPTTFTFANACFLKEPDEEGCSARIKNENLLSSKVQSFLKDGSQVTQLALEWCEQIRFVMKEDFSLGSVRFLEAVKDLTRDGMSESKEERLAADFLIMAETVQRFYKELLPCFTAFDEPGEVAEEIEETELVSA